MLKKINDHCYKVITKRKYRRRTLFYKTVFTILTIATAAYAQIPPNKFVYQRDSFVNGNLNLDNAGAYYNAPVASKTNEKIKLDIIPIDTSKGVIREVSAYNAGDTAQNDDSPCISASNDDICKMLEQGKKICATNAYPLHTKLYIENYGECEVLDKMNRRYSQRIDVAMKKDEKARALKFGVQNLKVTKIK